MTFDLEAAKKRLNEDGDNDASNYNDLADALREIERLRTVLGEAIDYISADSEPFAELDGWRTLLGRSAPEPAVLCKCVPVYNGWRLDHSAHCPLASRFDSIAGTLMEISDNSEHARMRLDSPAGTDECIHVSQIIDTLENCK